MRIPNTPQAILAALMRKRHVTLRTIARATGISYSTLQRIQAGQPVSMATEEKLIAYFLTVNLP